MSLLLEAVIHNRYVSTPSNNFLPGWILKGGITWLILLVGGAVLFGFYKWDSMAVTMNTEDIRRALGKPRFDGSHPCVYVSASGDDHEPHIGQCRTPAMLGSTERYEVDLRYGTFVLRQTDLAVNDVFDVPLTRSYTSNDWLPKSKVHAFGRSSSHPYDDALIGSTYPYTYIDMVLEDGDMIHFDRISKGEGYKDAVYLHSEAGDPFYGATIAWNGDGWTLQRADGAISYFPEAYATTRLAESSAFEMHNPQGDKLLLHRGLRRDLNQIETPHGRWLRFLYDDQHRIVKAFDDRGHIVQYSYDPDGMLADVVSASGEERHYGYSGYKMLSVRDAKGNILVRNTYNNGVVVGQQFANGDVYRYAYTWSYRRTHATSVVITLPGGKETNIIIGEKVPESVM